MDHGIDLTVGIGATRIARVLRERPNELVIDEIPVRSSGRLVGSLPETYVFWAGDPTNPAPIQ